MAILVMPVGYSNGHGSSKRGHLLSVDLLHLGLAGIAFARTITRALLLLFLFLSLCVVVFGGGGDSVGANGYLGHFRPWTIFTDVVVCAFRE